MDIYWYIQSMMWIYTCTTQTQVNCKHIYTCFNVDELSKPRQNSNYNKKFMFILCVRIHGCPKKSDTFINLYTKWNKPRWSWPFILTNSKHAPKEWTNGQHQSNTLMSRLTLQYTTFHYPVMHLIPSSMDFQHKYTKGWPLLYSRAKDHPNEHILSWCTILVSTWVRLELTISQLQ